MAPKENRLATCQFVPFMFYFDHSLGGDQMDVEKQREIVRLWNRMRRVEGPLAEEIRIQILQCFAESERVSDTRLDERRAVMERVSVQPGRRPAHIRLVA